MKSKLVIGTMLALLLTSVLAASFVMQEASANPEVRFYVWNPATGDNTYPGKPYPSVSFVEVWIDSPDAWHDTAQGIVGVTASLQVDPNVVTLMAAAQMPDNNWDGRPDSFLGNYAVSQGTNVFWVGGTIDAASGTITGPAEAIQGFTTLGKGAGGGPHPLMRFVIRTREGVDPTSYSPLALFNCSYYTADLLKHAVDVIDDGHYNVAPSAVHIRADGSVDPDTAPISSADKITYTFTDNIADRIVVEKDNIVVDGADYTLQPGFILDPAIDLTGRSNVTIKNTEITAFVYGINLDDSLNNTVSGNNITSGRIGIKLSHSSNYNRISGNIIAGWLGSVFRSSSIQLSWSSNHNSIYGNNVTGNDHGIKLSSSNHNSVSGNNITNNKYGIQLYGSSNNIISENNITNNTSGIELSWSSNNTIKENNITKSSSMSVGYGIELILSSHNAISGNTITENYKRGIWLWESSDNSISGNNITNNRSGIQLYGSSNNIISENNITNNTSGIELSWSSNNTIKENNITKSSSMSVGYGIIMGDSHYNTVSGNNITNNGDGISLWESSNNLVFHNNFVDNTQQVRSHQSTNVWDDGYPSGGNYWSDHVTVDDCCGENQDEPGSDGIVDELYVIDDLNRDNYPLAEPWSPAVLATIDIDPDTLNLCSKGEWITCYIELPENYNVSDIDISTVMLNGTIPVSLLEMPAPQPVPTEVGDRDNDTIPDLMVKFGRAEVASWICSGFGIQYGNVTLAITGELSDGTPFEGTCTIKVLFPGDADDDGGVDFDDFAILAGCYGTSAGNPCYSPSADFDEDGRVRYDDFLVLAGNYGKTAA